MTYPNDTHYSPNFTRAELNCKCGCKVPAGVEVNLYRLATYLEELRTLAGAPVQITSGYRCPKWNELCGGAKDSQHSHGYAADVWVRGKTPGQVKDLAEKIKVFKNGGIGVYRGWTHVDIRTTGAARWRG